MLCQWVSQGCKPGGANLATARTRRRHAWQQQVAQSYSIPITWNCISWSVAWSRRTLFDLWTNIALCNEWICVTRETIPSGKRSQAGNDPKHLIKLQVVVHVIVCMPLGSITFSRLWSWLSPNVIVCRPLGSVTLTRLRLQPPSLVVA